MRALAWRWVSSADIDGPHDLDTILERRRRRCAGVETWTPAADHKRGSGIFLAELGQHRLEPGSVATFALYVLGFEINRNYSLELHVGPHFRDRNSPVRLRGGHV